MTRSAVASRTSFLPQCSGGSPRFPGNPASRSLVAQTPGWSETAPSPRAAKPRVISTTPSLERLYAAYPS